MGKRLLPSVLCLLLSLLLWACRESAPQVPANKIEYEDVAGDMMELNRQFAELENDEIERYIDSLKLDLKCTGTGLRYKITGEGTGVAVDPSATVTFRYSIRLLDGTPCEKLTDKVRTLNLRTGEIERGIREGLALLNVGGSGYFILPSRLAFGVVGYAKCVPAWTPVICELTLVDVL